MQKGKNQWAVSSHGSYLTFNVSNVAAGTYDVVVEYTLAWDGATNAKVQLQVDGVAKLSSSALPLTPNWGYGYPYDLGDVSLTAGSHTFKLYNNGSNTIYIQGIHLKNKSVVGNESAFNDGKF